MNAPVGEWPVHCDPDATFGERIAQVAISVLADGMLSSTKRTAVWVLFAACGGNEKLIPIKGTTCAVFVGAVLHWAGRLARLPRYRSPTSITSWLDGLSGNSGCWRSYGTPGCTPSVGAIFYVEADSNPYNNHVGVLLREITDGVWLCAEGGGGADGSECKFTVRKWGKTWDSRRLRGLWVPSDAQGRTMMDRVGAPPEPGVLPLPSFPISKASSREDVKRWQDRLLLRDPKALPKFGPDGGWGTECTAATLSLQRAKGLPEDGTRASVDDWKACEP